MTRSNDNSVLCRVICQRGIQGRWRLLGEDHLRVLLVRVRRVGIRLIEHDAEDFTCCPGITHRSIPGCTKLLSSMGCIHSTFGVKFVITDAGIEWNVAAQFGRQVSFSKLLVLRRPAVYNLTRTDKQTSAFPSHPTLT